MAALAELNASTLARYHPPWFDDELNESGVRYFADRGVRVVHRSAVDLPSEQRSITPELLSGYIESTIGAEDAVFVAGNGQRAIGTVEYLERRLSRPVLTANQVLTWNALRLAGVTHVSERYGRIFGASGVAVAG